MKVTGHVVVWYFWALTLNAATIESVNGGRLSSGDSLSIVHLPEVVVTASRHPVPASNLCRTVEIISRAELENNAGRSLPEYLTGMPGVDISASGPWGVQADAGLRGASFEQTAVLIDGIPVADPQTGHHNLDLPLCPSAIQCIEILKGSGSHLYGSSAMGGAINLVTDRPSRRSLELSTEAGQHGLFRVEAAAAAGCGPANGWLAVSRTHSGGYRYNTDYDGWAASCGLGLPAGSTRGSLQLGYGSKNFGANGFYAVPYANARERTAMAWTAARWRSDGPSFAFSPAAYWRRHDDEYLLDFQRPEWYRNRHATFVYGTEARCSYRAGDHTVSIFGEQCLERIVSNRLGSHRRQRTGLSCEEQFRRNALTVIFSASAYRYSRWGWQLWPGCDLGYRLNPSLRIYGTIGRSFRVPTYTELFYYSPGKSGDSTLQPERSIAGEIGVSCEPQWLSLKAAVYRRSGRNLIDWARSSAADPWRAMNIDQITATGAEASAVIRVEMLLPSSPLTLIRLGCSHIQAGKEPTGLQSQYALNFCDQQIDAEIEQRWFGSLRQEWSCSFQHYRQSGRSLLVGTRLDWDISAVRFHVQANNLLNRSYNGAGYVPMPGRWITAGMSFSIQ